MATASDCKERGAARNPAGAPARGRGGSAAGKRRRLQITKGAFCGAVPQGRPVFHEALAPKGRPLRSTHDA